MPWSVYIRYYYYIEFWYNYSKPKYGDRAKLCYMDTDSFIIYVETEDFYKDNTDDVEIWFDMYDHRGVKMRF